MKNNSSAKCVGLFNEPLTQRDAADSYTRVPTVNDDLDLSEAKCCRRCASRLDDHVSVAIGSCDSSARDADIHGRCGRRTVVATAQCVIL